MNTHEVLTPCGPDCDQQHGPDDQHNANRVDTTREQVLTDIRAERARQIMRGWSTKHDDEHDTDTLVRLSAAYARKPGRGREPGYFDRERLVQSAALLVAAVEAMDRREQAGEVPA